MSTYLQLNLSRKEAREKIKEYSVRFWEVRFYKPGEKEEFFVGVDPIDGSVVKLKHVLADEAAGENLPRDEAFNEARGFLIEQGYRPSEFRMVENSMRRRLNRVDYEFSWRRSGELENAPFEVEVGIQGGRVGTFSPNLNIPDEFTHTYKSRRSPGIALNMVFLGLGAVLVIAAVYLGLQYYKKDEFDKRYAAVLAAASGALLFLSVVNSLPGVLYNVPSSASPSLRLVSMIIGGAIAALVGGGITLAVAGSGKRLSKKVLDFDAVDGILRTKGIRRRIRYSALRGFCLAFILLGIATLFYLVGSEFFGVWMPEESPYLRAVPTYVPALMSLTTGGTAAISEETVFRLFSIPLLKRYLKYTPLAVFLSSLIWGLGHTTFVVLPWYTRIIEVTILGIILGWAFLRYDLVTVISAHFSMNAILVGAPMLLAGTTWLKLNGVISIIIASLPVLISATLSAYEKYGTPPDPAPRDRPQRVPLQSFEHTYHVARLELGA
ncbi:hypothetical protein AKJ41_03140 [candidate division MSBL1 archaeon SCGC-AAA259O05]|uniref:CAAX prenyl protease 2/Lysostaphin resistance protein A-like domain-containing protein n=1 Tax=candidate division MSBL1 archaeon SCGC-AAA259O05 TaxID=1698271 RepID=A0A133V3I1_9EURY|nr:hypothetical protein AKJ41_03140 [candidate division MSBL1 archaeon SCGC-AAA259O05]